MAPRIRSRARNMNLGEDPSPVARETAEVLAATPSTPSHYDPRMVHPSFLEGNPWNPNAMEIEKFQALVTSMREQGYVLQPILVRAHPTLDGRYQIIDGEHRWKAAMENGFQEIPVVVIEETNERRAKLRTLAMNNIHGENVPFKLAHVLVDLYREFTPEEVAALTGVDKKEQDKALESLETVVQSDEANIRVDEDAVPVEITLLLMPESNRDYEIAMHRAVGIAAKATPLVDQDRIDYTRSMAEAMDLSGAKTRNAAFSAILAGFLLLTDEQKATVKQTLARRGRPELIIEETVSGLAEDQINFDA